MLLIHQQKTPSNPWESRHRDMWLQHCQCRVSPPPAGVEDGRGATFLGPAASPQWCPCPSPAPGEPVTAAAWPKGQPALSSTCPAELRKTRGLHSCEQDHPSALHCPRCSSKFRQDEIHCCCKMMQHLWAGPLSISDPDIQVTLTPIICWIFLENLLKNFLHWSYSLQLAAAIRKERTDEHRQ